jgi:hypothetical protein
VKSPLNNENYPEDSGFINDVGAHTARTIMFQELVMLFNATTKNSPIEEIRNKVYNENILHKKSISGRKESFGYLKKKYGLDPNIPLYNTLRWAWSVSEEQERPLLALLCALSRDASLRITADYIFSLLPGKIADKEKISALIEQAFPNSYSPSVTASMTRNLLSSWTQSGHLRGLVKKTRTKAHNNTSACVFALAIGYLAGYRGRMLLDTIWMRALDATAYEIQEYLQRAMKKGWIRYRESGGMMEISISDEIFKVGGEA